MKRLKDIFLPNKTLDKKTFGLMLGVQVAFVIMVWIFYRSVFFPNPIELFSALTRLLTTEDLLIELMTSSVLSLKSMLIAVVISLVISYATVIPFFRPLAFMVSKFRFLTLVGLSFIFTILTHSGHGLKVSLMVFGITVFFVTSMTSVIAAISKSEFNHARTLRMSEWQVVWEVIILGKIDQVFDLIRQNFAIAWMMLTMVEGIVRSEGGIGTLLLNQNKHFNLDAVFAIQMVILCVGILIDYSIGALKQIFCPYSSLSLERK